MLNQFNPLRNFVTFGSPHQGVFGVPSCQAFIGDPVLGPALATQDTDPEQVVAATVYTDLFIRVITAPALLATLVRFLMTASVDNKLISEVLVQRISCNGKVCVVTMQLFETLLSLNIEDVMLGLVFRHLVNCNFLLPSFR